MRGVEHLVDGPHHQGGAGGDEEITARRRAQGALEVGGDQALPEGDGGGLPRTPALAAGHRHAGLPLPLPHLALGDGAAADAHDAAVAAVDVHQALHRKAAALVQAVDVLRDQKLQVPAASQGRQGRVGRVRRGVDDHLPGLPLVAPVLASGLLAGQEVLVDHRPIVLPATAGRAEIGDARGRREAGSRQDDDALGPAPHFCELRDVPFDVCHRRPSFRRRPPGKRGPRRCPTRRGALSAAGCT